MKYIFNPYVALFIGIIMAFQGANNQNDSMFGGLFIVLISIACLFANSRKGSFKKWYYPIEIIFVLLSLYVIFGVEGYRDAAFTNPATFIVIPIVGLCIYLLKYRNKS